MTPMMYVVLIPDMEPLLWVALHRKAFLCSLSMQGFLLYWDGRGCTNCANGIYDVFYFFSTIKKSFSDLKKNFLENGEGGMDRFFYFFSI